jgi:hypothetical protein
LHVSKQTANVSAAKVSKSQFVLHPHFDMQSAGAKGHCLPSLIQKQSAGTVQSQFLAHLQLATHFEVSNGHKKSFLQLHFSTVSTVTQSHASSHPQVKGSKGSLQIAKVVGHLIVSSQTHF